MKNKLRSLFAPLLNIFERGDEPFIYKKSHRIILIVVGSLFLFLTLLLIGLGLTFGMASVLIPGVVFFSVGLTTIVIGGLGTDRAVSKIWGNK